MNEKEFYEESWRLQDLSHSREGALARLRQRLTYGRYELTADWLCDLSGALLDVGCGHAEIPLMAGPQFTKVVGIDIARNVLEASRAKLAHAQQPERFSLLEHDLNTPWPFEDGSFDVVTCVAVLEHLFDPIFAVGEMARVLRADGRLIVVVPNLAYFKHRAAVLLGELPETSGDKVGWDGGHLHYFTFASLRNLLREKGFQIEARGGDGLLGRWRVRVWPNLSLGNLDLRAIKSTGRQAHSA
jgi:SAM-dependent methyltransferase